MLLALPQEHDAFLCASRERKPQPTSCSSHVSPAHTSRLGTRSIKRALARRVANWTGTKAPTCAPEPSPSRIKLRSGTHALLPGTKSEVEVSYSTTQKSQNLGSRLRCAATAGPSWTSTARSAIPSDAEMLHNAASQPANEPLASPHPLVMHTSRALAWPCRAACSDRRFSQGTGPRREAVSSQLHPIGQ